MENIKKILNFRGINFNSLRSIFRAAYQEKLIENPEVWFEFLRVRNDATHIYNEEMAEDIYAKMSKFKLELEKVVDTVTKL